MPAESIANPAEAPSISVRGVLSMAPCTESTPAAESGARADITDGVNMEIRSVMHSDIASDVNYSLV